jgi:hypothetical protein
MSADKLKLLGWKKTNSLIEGLQETIEWYKSSIKNKRKTNRKTNRKKTIKGGLCLRDIGKYISCGNGDEYLVKTRIINWFPLLEFCAQNISDKEIQGMKLFQSMCRYLVCIGVGVCGIAISNFYSWKGADITNAIIGSIGATMVAKFVVLRNHFHKCGIMIGCAGPLVPLAIIVAYCYRYPYKFFEIIKMDNIITALSNLARIQGLNTAVKNTIGLFDKNHCFHLDLLDKFIQSNKLPLWECDVLGLGDKTIETIECAITKFLSTSDVKCKCKSN